MILVAGASGVLGGMITRRLLEKGERTRILVREGSRYEPLVDAGAEVVFGDLKDRASLDDALAGIDTVVTTANSATRGPEDNAQSVEIEGNRNLIDAAAAAGVRHFVFISAVGADPDSPIPFLQGKGLAERRLRESGMDYTILSPNFFMEVWIGMIVGMPLQQGEPVTLVGAGERRHSFVSMADVAAFAIETIANPAARNRQIPVGGPEAVSWNDIVERTGRVIGREISVRRVSPGEPLPGLPQTVSQLAAGLDGYDSPMEMEGAYRTYAVRPTTLDEFLVRTFGAAAG